MANTGNAPILLYTNTEANVIMRELYGETASPMRQLPRLLFFTAWARSGLLAITCQGQNDASSYSGIRKCVISRASASGLLSAMKLMKATSSDWPLEIDLADCMF